jgi:hypothetical protein
MCFSTSSSGVAGQISDLEAALTIVTRRWLRLAAIVLDMVCHLGARPTCSREQTETSVEQ